MGVFGEKLLKQVGRADATDRDRTVSSVEGQWRSAAKRFAAAQLAASIPGSLDDKRDAICTAMQQPNSPMSGLLHPPSRTTISAWLKIWNDRAGKASIEDYLDAPRSGRPPVRLLEPLAAIADRIVDSGEYRHVTRIHEDLEAEADRLHLKAPEYQHVLKHVGRLGLARRVAGRTGRKSAQISVLPHATLPYTRTHECHTLDELQSPVYSHQYEPTLGLYVSTLPTFVLLRDYASTAIPSWHIADPSRRVSDETKARLTTGHDSKDVLACLVSGAFKELAAPGCESVAGYRGKILRWDHHSTHETLRDNLILNAGYAIPDLQRVKPDSRGDIENAVGFLKRLCAGTVGHVDTYVPADRVNEEDERTRRGRAAATTELRTRRTEIAVRDTLSLDELRLVFGDVVRRYNEEHRHSGRGNQTPKTLYFDCMPRDVCSGRDLLGVLENQTVTFDKNGIAIQQDGHLQKFAWYTEQLILPPNTVISCRVDPLLRGIFAKVLNQDVFLPRERDYVKGEGARIAKTQRTLATLLGNRAVSARMQADIEALGTLALARGAEAARDERAADDDAEERDIASPAPRIPGKPAPSGSGALASPGTPAPSTPADSAQRGFTTDLRNLGRSPSTVPATPPTSTRALTTAPDSAAAPQPQPMPPAPTNRPVLELPERLLARIRAERAADEEAAAWRSEVPAHRRIPPVAMAADVGIETTPPAAVPQPDDCASDGTSTSTPPLQPPPVA